MTSSELKDHLRDLDITDSNKVTWLALCVGIALVDVLEQVREEMFFSTHTAEVRKNV